MKTYTPLILPKDSAWERTTWRKYTPIWFNRFIESVQNCIAWFPVIRKDKHWDGNFILRILKQKLIFQREELVRANRHEDVSRDNRDITICLNLIERLEHEFYEMECMDYEESHIDFIESELGPDLKELIINEGPERLDDYFNLHKATVKKCLKKNRKLMTSKRSLAFNVGQEKHKQCKRLLFSILEERMMWWWD